MNNVNYRLLIKIFPGVLFLFQLIVNTPAQEVLWEGSREYKNGIEYINNFEKGLWDADPAKKITIERVFSIGSMEVQEEYLFNWVQYITTDNYSNIYACDSKENRIQVYDKEGKYLRTIGQEGKGPGDLLRPMKVLVGNDGNIYVDDNLNIRISVFKANGRFLNSFRLKSYCMGMELDIPGNVLVYHPLIADNEGETSPIITEYSIRGKIERTYGKRQRTIRKNNSGIPEYANNELLMMDDGQLLVSFSYPYMIHFYNDGILKKIVTRESPVFTKPEIMETSVGLHDNYTAKTVASKQRSYIWQIFELDKGQFATFIRDSGEDFRKLKSDREFETYLDLFDSEGRFLKSFKWDWRRNGLIKHIDKQGFVYTNYGDNELVPGITKWKVSFE